MNDYYLVYYKPLKLFLRTPEGRFEHTMKEANEIISEYRNDKDKCPTGCSTDILIILNAKDILLKTKLPEQEENA